MEPLIRSISKQRGKVLGELGNLLGGNHIDSPLKLYAKINGELFLKVKQFHYRKIRRKYTLERDVSESLKAMNKVTKEKNSFTM